MVADIPMDKNYKIGEIQLKKKCFNRMFILWKKHRVDKKLNWNLSTVIKDFSRLPILSDDVFKAMDRNNDGQVSKEGFYDYEWK